MMVVLQPYSVLNLPKNKLFCGKNFKKYFSKKLREGSNLIFQLSLKNFKYEICQKNACVWAHEKPTCSKLIKLFDSSIGSFSCDVFENVFLK